VSGRLGSSKPRGIRRIERWLVGVAFAVIAFVLERVVVRAVRREGGPSRAVPPEARTFTSRGGDVDVD
jgi:hypothetical protein